MTLVAVAACAACAGPAHQDIDAPDSPVARYDWDPRDGGMAALLEGELRLEGDCLYVGEAVAAFPRSLATWDSRPQYLSYGGATYAVGDTVSAGGGFVDATTAEDVVVPDGCVLNEWNEVFLVQDEDLEPYAG